MPGPFQSNAGHGIPARGIAAVRGFLNGDNAYFEYPYSIAGVTRDASAAPLGNCMVTIFRTADNSVAAQGPSDANGAYRFPASPVIQHQIMAYLPGSPDVAGMTVNTVVGS
jgi:hypothetical protein